MKRPATGIRLLPLLLTIMLLMLGMTSTAMAENKFYFDKNYNAVFEGETIQLVLIREGDCADDGDLSFASSNQRAATVDENGVVYGAGKGSATITATLRGANRTWTAQITVTVMRAVTSIEVTGSRLTTYDPWDETVADVLDPNSPWADLPVLLLRVGKSQTITAVCSPSDATNRKWQLTTSDPDIVRASGTSFTGKAAGECLVTVQSVQNPEVYQAYRALVVQPVTRVRVNADVKSCFVGETIMLEAAITPDNATIQNVVWSSDRPDNASVDEYGVVTGVSKGSAVITAKAADGSGQYGTITVTIKQQAEEINLNYDSYDLKVGNYVTLRATVLPDIANDKTVTWSTSDASVAKVSTSGRVTAVSPGTAIITCESKTHPEVTAYAVISVYQPVTKVQFTDSSASVSVGNSIQLGWEVSPDSATNPAVAFSTNKDHVVSVTQDGRVTGLQRGECYVYATATDGSGKKATIKVTVTQPVEGVSIKYEERTVGVGSKVTNTAIFAPDDASITDMTWYTQDASIATVSGTGKTVTVTGRSWGETTIIGVTQDGSYVTSFTVTVGDENKPLNIYNLYVEDDNVIRIAVYNESNLTITRFYYVIETYDAWGYPVICNDNGRSNSFEGSYTYTLAPGTSTRHGRFTFGSEFNRPDSIGMIVMRITGYETEDGQSHYITRADQEKAEWQVTVLDGYNN